MKTLVKIVKCVGGFELWFRVEGQQSPLIEFIARPSASQVA